MARGGERATLPAAPGGRGSKANVNESGAAVLLLLLPAAATVLVLAS